MLESIQEGIWASRLYDSKVIIAIAVKGLFMGIGQFFRYLFLTPAGGSKRRAEQQAYEERLDEAMKRVQAEKDCKF